MFDLCSCKQRLWYLMLTFVLGVQTVVKILSEKMHQYTYFPHCIVVIVSSLSLRFPSVSVTWHILIAISTHRCLSCIAPYAVASFPDDDVAVSFDVAQIVAVKVDHQFPEA